MQLLALQSARLGPGRYLDLEPVLERVVEQLLAAPLFHHISRLVGQEQKHQTARLKAALLQCRSDREK